jgi:TetR/AcrR family transcriptional regulator, cholesterol catabolism regulator
VTSRERVNRRDTILLHAAELFATNGVSATTVRQIADRVGMLSGSLYHHFSSKDLIAEEIVVTYLDDLRAAYRELDKKQLEPLDMLREVVRISFDIVATHPHAVEIYQNETAFLPRLPRFRHIESVAKEIHAIWADVIEAGVAGGQFRRDVNPRLFHRLLRDAVWLSPRWFKPTKQYAHAQLAEDLLAVFLEGFELDQPRVSGKTGRPVAAVR